MRVFKFVGDTVHEDPNNPLGINIDGVYFALDKPTDVSDELGAKLERHSHFAELGAGELAGPGPGGGGSGGESATDDVPKARKKRVRKKKRAGKKAKDVV